MSDQLSVTILWADAPDPGEENWETYILDTEAELDAFPKGISEMDGWLGYEPFDNASDCKSSINRLREDSGFGDRI